MKKTIAILALILFVGASTQAFAFSTEQSTAQNNDGTAKFTDPDEKMPNFIAAPQGSSFGLQVLPSPSSAVTAPTPGQYDSGAAAFDQAYSHLDKR